MTKYIYTAVEYPDLEGYDIDDGLNDDGYPHSYNMLVDELDYCDYYNLMDVVRDIWLEYRHNKGIEKNVSGDRIKEVIDNQAQEILVGLYKGWDVRRPDLQARRLYKPLKEMFKWCDWELLTGEVPHATSMLLEGTW